MDRQVQGDGDQVNAEGNEKLDGKSTTAKDLDTTKLADDNQKVAGLSNGQRMADISKTANGTQ